MKGIGFHTLEGASMHANFSLQTCCPIPTLRWSLEKNIHRCIAIMLQWKCTAASSCILHAHRDNWTAGMIAMLI
ncbi:hypothetical protein CCR75_009157 [Bremia lactucae]|uniref:Uncharacterized protein n=1 Tax=Bremia lactucae TaxID=4779 RepID=A0A976FKY6_BRELC|nr:hypothetical protein CCR75_009157 [Bremia lactucae]